MSSTTMHFGPEWMRTKPQPSSRSQPPPSPPPTAPISGASTYSALVSPAPPQPEKRDEAHPFRYSKEEMLRIYKEGGGKGGLGIEVERWEGVVREVGTDPIGLREMDESEKKVKNSYSRNVSVERSYILCYSFLQALLILTSVDASPRTIFLRCRHRLRALDLV